MVTTNFSSMAELHSSRWRKDEIVEEYVMDLESETLELLDSLTPAERTEYKHIVRSKNHAFLDAEVRLHSPPFP